MNSSCHTVSGQLLKLAFLAMVNWMWNRMLVEGNALAGAVSQVLKDLREIVIIRNMAWIAVLRESLEKASGMLRVTTNYKRTVKAKGPPWTV